MVAIEVIILQYFLDTTETIPDGVGFAAFDGTHISWLVVALVLMIGNCILFRNLSPRGREIWKRVVAALIVLDELFKMAMLTIGNRYTWSYLPLHLCSINIIIIAIYTWKPSKTVGAFLYTVCIPGAVAALLFPSWTKLPFGNFMHMHSFTIHILLMLYPVVLSVNGEIEIKTRNIPKCLLLLIGMAIPIYLVNLLLDTNYMFLMSADSGNPLYLFEQMWGSHLLGFPVIITAIIILMYAPLELFRKLKSRKTKVNV